jgi:hypothetical protein
LTARIRTACGDDNGWRRFCVKLCVRRRRIAVALAFAFAFAFA